MAGGVWGCLNGFPTAVPGEKMHRSKNIRHDIYVADECFLTGTAAEVIAVVSLDGRTICAGKPGPMTCDLRDRFQKLTRNGG